VSLLCDVVQSSPSRSVFSVRHWAHAESLLLLGPYKDYGLVSASLLETQVRSIALCADLCTETQSNRIANLESMDKKLIYAPE
jgi:hypothetical protein